MSVHLTPVSLTREALLGARRTRDKMYNILANNTTLGKVLQDVRTKIAAQWATHCLGVRSSTPGPTRKTPHPSEL